MALLTHYVHRVNRGRATGAGLQRVEEFAWLRRIRVREGTPIRGNSNYKVVEV